MTVLFGVICCCFAATPDLAHGASGDVQNATIRVRNIDPYGNTASVQTLFEDSLIRWEMNASGMNVSPVNIYKPKESSWRLSFRTSANGQIQPILYDKYGIGWQKVFTVRHGVTTMIYDMERGFNMLTFKDPNGRNIKFDSVHFTDRPGTYSSGNSCIGDANGYIFPVFGSGTHYLVCRYQGRIINIDISSIANTWNHYEYGPIDLAATRSTMSSDSADKIKIDDSKKITSVSGKTSVKMVTPKAAKGMEPVEINTEKK